MGPKRTFAGVFLAVAAAVGVAARQAPQFRTETHLVPVYATVTDASGRLVPDLTRDDFEVFDNGRPQPITTFARDPQPITVVVMIDRSGSVEPHFALVEDAAAEFVSHLTPQDRARIGSFSVDVQLHPETFTSDQQVLRTIVRERLLPAGPTPLWRATDAALTALAGEAGRRVALLFTDGRDAPASGDGRVAFEDVRRRVETEDVMVYAVGLTSVCVAGEVLTVVDSGAPASAVSLQQSGQRGGQGRGGPARGRIRLPAPPLPFPRPGRGAPPRPPGFGEPRLGSRGACREDGPDPSLRVLAAVGGGGYFELRRAADLRRTFARVAEELHLQYLLAFRAPEHDGRFHRVEVRARGAGLTVRARRGYVAPGASLRE